MSDSVQPFGLQSARLFFPWDSPGKNTEVDCHFLIYLVCFERTLIHMYVYTYIHCAFINNETYAYYSGIYAKNIIAIFPGE